MFERSADKEWYNPSRTSSDSRGDPLEKSCLGVGNSKTRKTLRQQPTIIYCSMFRLHTVARESVRVYEQIQRDMCPLQPDRILWMLTFNWQLTDWLTDWLLFQNSLIFIYLNSGYRWRWYHLAKLLRHLSRVQNSPFSFLQSNLSQKRYESNFFTFLAFLCWTLCTRLNFPIWLTFPLKDFS